ncbi:peptide methionine sulfoxide reductase-like [Planococcus citri]|uniref:peptide methionine sulfoxide reductase-like n=1 Tax=Planococcus citri TaxID=170843 RepID=UPI0031F84FFF
MTSLLHDVDIPTKQATFAMACFWSPDCIFGVQNGVIRTRVGYSGGTAQNPTYRKLGDHTESILIDYNPNAIQYEELLDIFWKNHDPTSKMKRQYTSLIFYHDEEQKQIAEKSFKEKENEVGQPLVTEILPASTFYDAEDYHQKYRLQQHPWLCKAVGLQSGTDFKRSHLAARLNGYVYGQGNLKGFNEEVENLGLNESVADFVRTLIIKNEGQGLTC